MESDRVVEVTKIVGEDCARMVDIDEDAPLDALVFERREEALGDGVVRISSLAPVV